MTTPLAPAGVKVQGNQHIIFSPTGDLAAPSLAVLTGVGALDMSNMFYADSGRYSAESTTGAAPARMGSKKIWQQFGSTNESMSGALRYVVDPQAVAGSDGKKAYEALPEGTTGILWFAPGVDVDTDLAAGDFVYGVPVKVGKQVITGDPTDEFAEFAVEQGVIVTAPGAGDLVALVA